LTRTTGPGVYYAVSSAAVAALLLLGGVTIWERRSRRTRLIIRLPLFVLCCALIVWQVYLLAFGRGS
jgi:bacteriorhodopsin